MNDLNLVFWWILFHRCAATRRTASKLTWSEWLVLHCFDGPDFVDETRITNRMTASLGAFLLLLTFNVSQTLLTLEERGHIESQQLGRKTAGTAFRLTESGRQARCAYTHEMRKSAGLM